MIPEHWWNAHQVLAWVFNRKEDLVSRLSDHQPPDSNIPRLVGVARDDGSIHGAPDIDGLILLARAHLPGAEFDSSEEALFDIRLKLQAGIVDCWGRRAIGSELEKIPSPEWADLEIVFRLGDSSAEAAAIAITDAEEGVVQAPIWLNLRFNRDQVLECWPAGSQDDAAPEPAAAAPKPEPETAQAPAANVATEKKHPGGAPRKYDRAAFQKEMMRLANTPDGLPDRPELFRHMTDWCSLTWGCDSIPSDSAIREWIAAIYPPPQ